MPSYWLVTKRYFDLFFFEWMEMVAVDSFIDVKVKGLEKLSRDFLYFMPFRDTIVMYIMPTLVLL